MNPAYEKLGVFYLGRAVSPDTGETSAEPLLYDSKDLTTHAVCVGMTGSGKTGLCVSLLEEAAIDRIPALLIDPKGDLGNLMLTFPDLTPADFRPWIDEAAAMRKGMTPDEFAKSTAALWAKGLADWEQDGERIRRLREAADVAIYTPGGSAGIPLRVLRSFAAPPPALVGDAEAFRDRIASAVSGLLVLIGVDADPVQSREHILVSTILDRAWREGRSLDLPALIREVQDPPFAQVGVLDVESFFPQKDRFGLAMRINNVLASPGFAAWMEGEPLEIDRLLHTPEGKPRLAILSIAHLGEAERMFFVTLLLNEVVSWMRAQPGTGSLRALLYMDEVFGYLPPSANPPSKTPMLTLLKQARAYGLGVVLATQNPVDLDYKALSNAGTWFLGRLQTERDKMRVLDGLEGASAATGMAFDRARVEKILSGLDSRVFLMNNVHDERPELFRTRWAMSYLRGPLTRAQIETLMAPRKGAMVAAPIAAAPTAAAAAVATPPAPGAGGGERPVLPPGIPEVFVETGAGVGERVYRPALLGRGRLHYVNASAGVDDWQDVSLLSVILDKVETEPWESAEPLDPSFDVRERPAGTARFVELPAEARTAAGYKTWEKALAGYLYRERPLALWRCRELKVYSKPGETEGDFRARLTQTLRENRDVALEKLKKKYATKFTTLQEKIRKTEQRVEREKDQAGQQKLQTAVAVGATVLGALFGRKVASVGTVGRASTAMGRAGRMSKEAQDVARAQEDLATARAALEALEKEFAQETESVEAGIDAGALELEELTVRPRKTDLSVQPVTLAWLG